MCASHMSVGGQLSVSPASNVPLAQQKQGCGLFCINTLQVWLAFVALDRNPVCVMQALVMDTAGLSRQSKSLDSQLANIRHLCERTSGQLVRSAWVFSTALGIPSPLSETAAER